MNSAPNLIVGFEDIITHIKNQEKRIEELENKNEELLDKCHQRFKENAKNISLGANVYHRIKKENEELLGYKKGYERLKEENKELQESNQQYIDMFNAIVSSEGEKVDRIESLEKQKEELQDIANSLFKQIKKMNDETSDEETSDEEC